MARTLADTDTARNDPGGVERVERLDAGRTARDHAQGQMGLGPLISLVPPDNLRSRHLAERLGAVIETEGYEVRGTPCLIYRHPQVPA